MRKLLIAIALFVLAAGFAEATTITASNTIGGNGQNIAAGSITFRATDQYGNPFFGHQSGLMIPKAVVCMIVNGAITTAQGGGTCTVVDTSATSPAHFCYAASIYDAVSRWTAPPIACLQPTGSMWSLNSYIPTAATTAIVNTGPVGATGQQGPTGAAGGLPGATDVSTLAGSDFGAKLAACISALNSTYGGICEARTLGGTAQSMASILTITMPNTVINLPCATITTAQSVIVPAGVRNVTIHGCAYQGGSNASGIAGGTVWVYTGSGVAFQVGDTTYAQDTHGFRLDNVNLNTAAAGNSAGVFSFYRTQEIDLRSVYLNGNQLAGQTGIYLDGTGNYSGGTFDSDTLNGFGTGVYMTGHLSGSVVGDFANASTFTRLHVACPTSGGFPIAGTYGVNAVAADGNTWNGGDIEGCATMFHLGANAINNTIIGLRNENSNIQYQADSGSSDNAVFTGGTFFTGQLVDNGHRNSFWDAFHRTANGIIGDWYGSQVDSTITNHAELGIGLGNVRGISTEYETDVPGSPGNFRYAWQIGLTDGTAGSQQYFINDLLNNVPRFGILQGTTAGGNWQSFLNATGTASVCFQCSTNAGTGGIVVSSGGASPTEVAGFDGSGNETLLGQLNFYSGSTLTWEWECNSLTSCQLRNANATTPMSPLVFYTNAGTEIDSQGTAAVVINNHSTAGTGGFIVYEGGANYTVPALTVGSNGSATIANSLAITNHLNQAATADFAGTCSMSSATSCTVSFQHSWASQPACTVTPQYQVTGVVWYTWATNVVTVHTSSTNTGAHAVICVGNPN